MPRETRRLRQLRHKSLPRHRRSLELSRHRSRRRKRRLPISRRFQRRRAFNPNLLVTRWQAQWIRPQGSGAKDFGVYHLRKSFTLDAVPKKFVVNVTADNRYELFVNGTRAATGPARGDLDHWRFETVDLAPQLKAGDNVLAAVVWNFGGDAPMAQVTYETGFLLQGDTKAEAVVNTNKTWKGTENTSVTLVPIDRAAIFHEYYVGSTGEQVDAATYPWGWQTAGVRRPRLGRSGRDHDRWTTGDPRLTRPLVPDSQNHSADGRHAGTVHPSRSHRWRSATGRLPAGLVAVDDPRPHDSHARCWIAAI